MKGIIDKTTIALFTFFTCITATIAASDTILTVDFVTDQGAVSKTQTYSLEDLRSLQVTTFETETIWTEGSQAFTGVPLASFVEELGLTKGEIEAVAINAYSVRIPVQDAVEGGPIIAFERTGSEMSIRNKGPLWVVYPYDSNPAYRTEAIYSRSIWQLEKLVVTK